MDLYLDKILSQLVYPLGLAISLVLLGLILLAFARRRLAVGLFIIAILWVGLWSLPAVSDALRLSLEDRFDNVPAEELPAAPVAILLGGGMRSAPAHWPYPDLDDGADRIWHAARLYHAGRAGVILVSGGNLDWQGRRESAADAMAGFLRDLDVPEEAILLESRSRNTRENAVYSAELLDRHDLDTPVLLVTSALHMHRARAAFRAAGVETIPAPADFEVMPEPSHALRWMPDSEALHDSTRALKEYLGYWVYRLRGWAR